MIDPRIAETNHYVKLCMREDELAHSLSEQPWVSSA
jgi:hypothetical protein